MAIKAAMWVHGNIVEAEYLDRLQSWIRRGWGTHFIGKPGTDNWFHFPITTPVILDGNPLRVAKVFVFYDTHLVTAAGPIITDIHVYDGLNKVKEFNRLPNLAGKCDTAVVDGKNGFVVTPPIGIAFGLSLSVHVQFVPQATPVGQDIAFATAGADFVL